MICRILGCAVALDFLRFFDKNNHVKNTPKMVENAVVKMVGNTISAGAALFKAVRTAMIDVGMRCTLVALITNNIAEEYSAFWLLSKSCAA